MRDTKTTVRWTAEEIEQIKAFQEKFRRAHDMEIDTANAIRFMVRKQLKAEFPESRQVQLFAQKAQEKQPSKQNKKPHTHEWIIEEWNDDTNEWEQVPPVALGKSNAIYTDKSEAEADCKWLRDSQEITARVVSR